MTLPNHFDEPVAATYDAGSAEMFDPAALEPTVDLLAELAGDLGGTPSALELAVGTGRVALPLAARNSLAIAGITLFALVWQMRWGTIPDTSWLITVCERMLSGERLYAEIYETNPPFSVWL